MFRNANLLDEIIDTAIEDNTFRSDDLEFTFAARVCPPSYPVLLLSFRGKLTPTVILGVVGVRLFWRLCFLPGPFREHTEVF